MCISCETRLWNSRWLPPSYSWNQWKDWQSISSRLTRTYDTNNDMSPYCGPIRQTLKNLQYNHIIRYIYNMLYYYICNFDQLCHMPKCLSLTHAPASHGFHVHRILSPPSSTWQFGQISLWHAVEIRFKELNHQLRWVKSASRWETWPYVPSQTSLTNPQLILRHSPFNYQKSIYKIQLLHTLGFYPFLVIVPSNHQDVYIRLHPNLNLHLSHLLGFGGCPNHPKPSSRTTHLLFVKGRAKEDKAQTPGLRPEGILKNGSSSRTRIWMF